MLRLSSTAGLALAWTAAMWAAVPAPSSAQTAEPAARGAATTVDAPKVAVVVSGDPDGPLRRAAERVDRVIEGSDALIGPGDPGLRGALRGEPAPREDDGLERARRTRRRLGWGESRDLSTLVELGRMAGADALVVVRRADAAMEAVVVDVRARAFYEGSVDPDSDDEQTIASFVRSRARAAATRSGSGAAGQPAAAPAPGAAAEDTAQGPEAATGADGSGPSEGAEGEGEEESSWIERSWPYLVAGALLVGTVLFFALRDRGNDPAQPMLRFRPGGDP